eukprot:319472-Pyramimonas_sp.AAC.1
MASARRARPRRAPTGSRRVIQQFSTAPLGVVLGEVTVVVGLARVVLVRGALALAVLVVGLEVTAASAVVILVVLGHAAGENEAKVVAVVVAPVVVEARDAALGVAIVVARGVAPGVDGLVRG